jgi:hypothetical protein
MKGSVVAAFHHYGLKTTSAPDEGERSASQSDRFIPLHKLGLKLIVPNKRSGHCDGSMPSTGVKP